MNKRGKRAKASPSWDEKRNAQVVAGSAPGPAPAPNVRSLCLGTKVVWFDTETTGVDHKENGLVQLAAVYEESRKVLDTFEIKCKPFKGQIVTAEACKVHGFKINDLRTDPAFVDPLIAHAKFVEFLARRINKFDKGDKAYCGGQNITFDINFLSAWFEKCGDGYLGSFLARGKRLDVLSVVSLAEYAGLLKVDNFKLETLAAHFGVELKAHDALSDILAAREIFYKTCELLRIEL
jgi:DNA polymerase-3 subunit epsilon